MKAHCWFCNSEQEFKSEASRIALAYGSPDPCLELSVRSIQRKDGKVISFVCANCRRSILQTIVDSKVAAIDNVLAGAVG